MARTRNKLTARSVVSALKKPGRYSDGGGLYLVVTDNGRARWVFRYTVAGSTRDMGLGSAQDVDLADARRAAEAARKHLEASRDPIEARETERRAAAGTPTFGKVAEDMLSSIEAGFRNEKHRAQWRSTLATYAAGLTNMPVDKIGTDDVLACLKPIWLDKNETASRVRGRIERVLDAAAARRLRPEANPARWKGHLDKLLPARPKGAAKSNHPAMPYAAVPAFMGRLRGLGSVSALALEFLILTAARSGEVRGARWGEIDRDRDGGPVWTVPGSRMKAGRDHRVPLTPQAVAVLDKATKFRASDTPDELVFPSTKRGVPLSDMALSMCLRGLVPGVTVHGFRSSFRDWAGDETDFAREVAEAALAHTVGDAVERAYRRGDALAKRRALMDAWAAHVDGTAPVAARAA